MHNTDTPVLLVPSSVVRSLSRVKSAAMSALRRRGEGVVVGTGEKTEIGKIAKMISESKDEMTPLQKRILCVALSQSTFPVLLTKWPRTQTGTICS